MRLAKITRVTVCLSLIAGSTSAIAQQGGRDPLPSAETYDPTWEVGMIPNLVPPGVGDGGGTCWLSGGWGCYAPTLIGIGLSNPAYPLHVATTSQWAGVFQGVGANSRGVFGTALSPTGVNYGGFFTAASTDGIGVFGKAVATSGVNIGVKGESSSPSGWAGYFVGNQYVTGKIGIGVGGTPQYGLSVAGPIGDDNPTQVGVHLGRSGIGDGCIEIVTRETTDPAAWIDFKKPSQNDFGARIKYSPFSDLLHLQAAATVALDGNVGMGTTAPTQKLDVRGNMRLGDGSSVEQDINFRSASGNWEVGTNNSGTGTPNGNMFYIYDPNATGSGTAYRFTIEKGTGRVGVNTTTPSSNLHVNGSFTATTKNFIIDHPSDPANKYFSHGCVESNEYKNIYDGTVITNGSGYATVTLPEWFDDLNESFRYQLTVMNDSENDVIFAKVYRKIGAGSPHQFTIKTSFPGIEVSWQVTGNRKDAYVKAHPLTVEKDKGADRGKYLNPEEHGKPSDMGIGAAPKPTAKR